MTGSWESTVASPAFMTLLSLDLLLMVTPCLLQTLVSSTPPSKASTVIVIPAHLALAYRTKSSLDRPALRVSPGLFSMAAQSPLPILVSSIPLSLAYMGREMPGLVVQAFPILS